jgi:cobalt/nickel transport system permease protein
LNARDPRRPLLLTLAFIVFTAATPFPFVLAAVPVLAVLLTFYRRRWRAILQRSVAPLALIAILAVGIPWSRGWVSGWDRAGIALVRAALSITALSILLEASTVSQMLVGLQRLHAPRSLAAILAMMIRYLHLLLDEKRTMERALRARRFAESSWLALGRTQAGLVGRLFVRSLDRAERVHAAMLARGWDGEIRTLNEYGRYPEHND